MTDPQPQLPGHVVPQNSIPFRIGKLIMLMGMGGLSGHPYDGIYADLRNS